MHNIEVAYCDICHTCLSVCLSMLVARLCPAKTAKPIKMMSGELTLVGPRNHVLDVVKFRRIHLPPQGVARWRCRPSSIFSDHSLLLGQIAGTQYIRCGLLRRMSLAARSVSL